MFIAIALCIGVNTGHLKAQTFLETIKKKSVKPDSSEPHRIAQMVAAMNPSDIDHPFIIDRQTLSEKSQDGYVDAAWKVSQKSLSDLYNRGSQSLKINVPIDQEHSFNLVVYQTEILSADYHLNLSGREVVQEANKLPKFYRGIVEGYGNSIVSLTLMNDEIEVNIHHKFDNYRLSRDRTHPDRYRMMQSQQVKKPICTTDDNRYYQKNLVFNADDVKKQKSGTCVSIYIETDKFTYDGFNQDENAVQNYFLSLFNEVATLYANENVSVQLTQLYIPTTTAEDWSASESFINILLEKFAETRQNDYTGRIAHFATLRDLGGGIGWIDVLCSDYSTFWADWDGDGTPELHHYGPYSVSTGLSGINVPFPDYSYDVAVVTHELGHNLGSFHTHACAWGPSNQAIDDCASLEGNCTLLNNPPLPQDLGTIMSYCHTTSVGIDFTKGFGSLPGQLIRDKIANAVCTLNCDENVLYGCTDPNYHNYNPESSIDDGSCEGTCSDAIRNGDETGIDCGGVLCLPCNVTCNFHSIRITLNFDNHPEETSWEIKDIGTNQVIAGEGPYIGYPDGSTEIIDVCLEDGSYEFTIYDSWGDGMCCSSGNGSYLVVDEDSNTLASGGNFTNEESTLFDLDQNNCENTVIVSGENVEGMFQSSQMVMTSGVTIIVDQTTFSSNEIDLYPDFEVSPGNTFEVMNDGCGN